MTPCGMLCDLYTVYVDTLVAILVNSQYKPPCNVLDTNNMSSPTTTEANVWTALHTSDNLCMMAYT
jgi:hypothetical protein